MVEVSVLQRALSECWAAEVSGVAYYEALGERFPEHRQEFDVLALVEKFETIITIPRSRHR